MQELYYTDVRALEPFFEQGLALLDPERREKTLRLRKGVDRLSSLAAGLLLRRYLGLSEPLVRAPSGKPENPGGLPFSLSHGGNLAVLAVSSRAVGVDSEPLGRRIDPAFYPRVLTPEEIEWLRSTRDARFAVLWTRKESVMKACGLGLTLPPAAFSVLGDTTAPENEIYTLGTTIIDGHAVSTAAVDPEPFRPRTVSVQALLG